MKPTKLFFFCAVLAAAGCGGEKAKPPLKIGINAWPGFFHAFIARDKGYFEKNGVKVELVYDADFAVNVPKYTGGELDGVFYVWPDIILKSGEGLASKVVYVCDYSETADVLLARPEIKSLADLKGRKVGVGAINSFSHLFALTLLEKAGLREAQLRFEVVPAREALKALEEGRIAAAHTWEPARSEGLKKGYKILATAKDTPGIMTDVLAFRESVVKERPEEIKAVLRALFEARLFFFEDRAEALAIMAKASGLSAAEIDGGMKDLHLPDLRENSAALGGRGGASLYSSGVVISEFYLARGQLTRLPDLDALIEPAFVRELEKE